MEMPFKISKSHANDARHRNSYPQSLIFSFSSNQDLSLLIDDEDYRSGLLRSGRMQIILKDIYYVWWQI